MAGKKKKNIFQVAKYECAEGADGDLTRENVWINLAVYTGLAAEGDRPNSPPVWIGGNVIAKILRTLYLCLATWDDIGKEERKY